MRVLQPGGELDLPLEALDVDRGAHIGGEHLDDHLTSQPGFLGEEDTAHPPASQFLQDAVGITQSSLQPGLETDGGPRGREAETYGETGLKTTGEKGEETETGARKSGAKAWTLGPSLRSG